MPTELGGSENILGPIGEMSSPLDMGANDPDPSDHDEDEDTKGVRDKGTDSASADESDESDDSGDADSEDEGGIDVGTNLLNGGGPTNVQQPIDQPITSGGDAGGIGPDGY